jgi:toxin-antitoxin system PIN domain toxin
MFLMDVNVLVYAHREDTKDHLRYLQWLESVLNGNTTFGYSELVLSGFLRIVTHRKIFEMPSSLSEAIQFANQIRDASTSIQLSPRPDEHHWEIFIGFMNAINAKGNDIPDAYHAALAMEWGCVWITTDKGFKRFEGLKSRHPFDLPA